ncbi:hypothetical protein HY490_02030 [Candidatus Woesearchaeota archaeon]|nr:hypothetical protein [Candidatus Woesearchaeota archaeon]
MTPYEKLVVMNAVDRSLDDALSAGDARVSAQIMDAAAHLARSSELFSLAGAAQHVANAFRIYSLPPLEQKNNLNYLFQRNQ